MEYTLETANRLAAELRALPPKDPAARRLDKQGMVKHLAQEIIALQQRGYTIEEVAESLRGRGLEITTPTLKNYLQRAKAARGKRPKARQPSAKTGPEKTESGQARAPGLPIKAPPTVTSPEPPPPLSVAALKAAVAEKPAAEPALRGGRDAFLVKDKDSY